jgi:BBSome-interacting protein 1
MEKSAPLPVEKQIKEIMPKAGLVYSEKASLSEVLCKPKILPLKSVTL